MSWSQKCGQKRPGHKCPGHNRLGHKRPGHKRPPTILTDRRNHMEAN